MKRQKYPSVSILTITYNPNLSAFRRSLESIRRQNYPKSKIEHIVVDGGSKKEVITLAKEFGCQLIIRPDLRNKSEARRSYAVKAAKNEIVFWLESDNILMDDQALAKLVQPFLDDPQIISTFTLHYGINPQASALDRYCALVGASDPVAMYLGKADREPWYKNKYSKGKLIRRKKNYDVVEFSEKSLPTVGDNGFLTRREVLMQARISPKEYVHIDIYVDLLKKGYRRFAVVRTTAIEHIIGDSLFKLLKRRMIYAQWYSLSTYLNHRRYLVYNADNSVDKLNLIKFVLFSATFIQPFLLAIYGFLVIRDQAWFLHPIACFLFLLYYMRQTATSLTKLRLKETK